MKVFMVFSLLVLFFGTVFGENSTESKEEFIYILNGAAKNVNCQYDDVCFNPSVLVASPNTKVTWFAQESGHKITSGTRTQTDDGILTTFDGKFQSRYLNVNDTFSHTFTESGTYDFHSLIFGHASGKVIITKSEDSPTYHSEEKCDLRQDLKIYDKLLQNDSVVRTFLTKFPTATYYVNGIDESSPLKAPIVYEYGRDDAKKSLTVYIREEGTIQTDCFSPVFYTYKYFENNDTVNVQYYYGEKQQMIDFLNDHIISSPLKQIQSGITFDEIQCKQNLVLAQKYDGTPACVTSKTISKLIERGWAKIDKMPRTFDYVIKKGNVTYGSQYEIVGGIVDEIVYDGNSNSLIIPFSESEGGYIQIVIQEGVLHQHRQLPYSYSVLIEGKNAAFDQFSPIILKIPFEKDIHQIEIIGTR